MVRIMPKTLAIACSALCAIVITSCSGHGDHDKNPFEALRHAPFKAVTDSLGMFPGNAELYLRRAALLSQHNLQDIATPDYKKAWELTKDEGVELEYISNLFLTNQIAEGIALLRRGAEEHPENTEFNRRLGEVYLQKNQPDSALAQFDIMIGKDSSNFEAWYEKGNLLAAQKDTVNAIRALEHSFALMPINYSGIALAGIYAAQKNHRALDICNMLLAKDSGALQTEPVYMKGVYYSETGQYDRAIKQFDTCIGRDWKMTDAYIEKGIILLQLKKTDSALTIFNMAATVSNTDPDAYFWMGRCYEAKGDKQQAAANYDRAYALDNSFIEAREGLHRVTK